MNPEPCALPKYNTQVHRTSRKSYHMAIEPHPSWIDYLIGTDLISGVNLTDLRQITTSIPALNPAVPTPTTPYLGITEPTTILPK
jgi:hypothetical protein